MRTSSGNLEYRRRLTRVVRVGDVSIGGDHPIRIQSMTTTNTQDIAATADQTEALVSVGCEIVRIAAPSRRDVEALAAIRRELDLRGIHVPLVADIHFIPMVAMLAAEAVEKVRVNPGNFADKKRFEVREYSDAEYAAELERVAGKFRPLVKRLKTYGRSLRIGTNHGSLSDRVLNRYGDTPLGMVESALEFLDVCEQENFRDVVFSMKSSNPQVAIQAYRLLADRLEERAPGEPSYPFHVGVTEAGAGDEGRIKSAIGIGSLLEDGIGDTVRVSLTEDPAHELPVARELVGHYQRRKPARIPVEFSGPPDMSRRYAYMRRDSESLTGGAPFGGDAPVRVEVAVGRVPEEPENLVAELRELSSSELAVEGVLVDIHSYEDQEQVQKLSELLSLDKNCVIPLAVRTPAALMPSIVGVSRWVIGMTVKDDPYRLALHYSNMDTVVEWHFSRAELGLGSRFDVVFDATQKSGLSAAFSAGGILPVHATRGLAALLQQRESRAPIVLRYERNPESQVETSFLRATCEIGAPLCDGVGDLVSLGGFGDLESNLRLAYRILQGARLRTSWTEFISCPSCGRTLFDLEEVTAQIKEKTGHLRGVKIAVMGCIVNGPGEMADADFGYVGSGRGKVSLYVGNGCVAPNIPTDQATERLIEIIRENGRWVDPI